MHRSTKTNTNMALLLALLTSLSAQAKSPNIVFILADDLDQELFSHENKIDRLITQQGMAFNNNYVSLSLCCPSRASILRGQYAHNSGMYDNQLPDGGFKKFFQDGLEQSTAATWLTRAGYRTALIGKYLNGYPNDGRAAGKTYIPPGWSHWIVPNGGNPYTRYGYSLNENGKTVGYANAAVDHLDDVLADKASGFIKDSVKHHPDQPFFLFLAPYAPHRPAVAPVRHLDEFNGLRAPRPVSFNEPDISDKPAWLRAIPPLTAQQVANIDHFYRKRRQSMLVIGDMVENLVNTLEEVGELPNTYIFVSSDNGFHQGQHRLASGKDTAFEEDIKVPLVVRGPGVPARTAVTRITANVDLAPTWAQIAGIDTPKFVDGRSLLPFLKGGNPRVWRKALLLEHRERITPVPENGLLEPRDPYDDQLIAHKTKNGAANFVGLRIDGHAIDSKKGAMSYIEYETGERELYLLWKDPFQIDNAHDKAKPALKRTLSSWLGLLRGSSGKALRNAEKNPP